MYLKFFNSVFLVGLLGATIPTHLACQSNPRETKLRDFMRSRDVDMTFFGRVVDDSGRPVEGAEVHLVIRRFSLRPPWFETADRVQLKSSKDGIFSIQNERGRRLIIEKITKNKYDNKSFHESPKGFDFIEDNGNVLFYYQNIGEGGLSKLVPDPRNPVAYRLRKKGPEAFLMKGGGGFSFTIDESGTYKGYDFFREGSAFPIQHEELEHPKVYGEPVTCDLRIRATFDPTSSLWTLVLAPGNADGGILASKDLLYEAPATGYQPSLTILVPAMMNREPRSGDLIRTPVPARYLYLRSRKEPTHSIYSRIDLGEEIRASWAPPPKKGDAPVASIHLSASATFNPYGERILEEATDLPWPVARAIRGEAEEAHRRGERPEAPNLAQRVKLWEQSRPLVDKVKDWFKP